MGCLAKILLPGSDNIGLLPTMGIGVVGSYIGGFFNWLIGSGVAPFEPSGIVMGIVGGVLACWLYRKYKINRFLEAQKAEIENGD